MQKLKHKNDRNKSRLSKVDFISNTLFSHKEHTNVTSDILNLVSKNIDHLSIVYVCVCMLI